MSTKAINFISLIIAIIGTILTAADQWLPAIAYMFPNATHSGPIIIGAAVVLRQVLRVIQDYLDDGQINNSVKIILLFATLQMAACSGSGEGGSWTPQDTAAAMGTINQGMGAVNYGVDTYNRIAHPEHYYQSAPVIVPYND